MSYRKLPEQGRAMGQLIQDLVRRVTFLERRVRYPGRVRVVDEANSTITTSFSGSVASLNLQAGAWLVHAAVSLHYASTINASENATAQLVVSSQETGATLETLDSRQWTRNGTTVTPVRQPLALIGCSTWSEPVTIDLTLALSTTGGAHNLTCVTPQIIAQPV